MKLSIIIPVYNAEQYLRRCVESITNQVVSDDVEIILVNDGSTDNSEYICNEFAEKFCYVKTYSHSNHGVSYTRNRGLEYANGEYIWFVDADDYIEVGFLEYLLQMLRERPDIVSFSYVRESINGKKEHLKIESCTTEACLKDLFCLKVDAAVWQFVLRRGIVGNIRFDEGIFYSEDALFLVTLFLKNYDITTLNRVGYHYVINEFGAVNAKFSPKRLTTFSAIDQMEQAIMAQDASMLQFFNYYKAYFYYYLLLEIALNSRAMSNECFQIQRKWLRGHKKEFYKCTSNWKDYIKFKLLLGPCPRLLSILGRFKHGSAKRKKRCST